MVRAVILSGLIVSSIALGAGPGAAMMGGEDHKLLSFSEIDSDGNGQLTPEEFAAHRQAMFDKADADGNGVLSQEEMAAKMQNRMERRMGRFFERADRNGDGGLSMEEVTSRRHSPEDRFARLDADESGTISEEEFAQARQKMRERRRGTNCVHDS